MTCLRLSPRVSRGELQLEQLVCSSAGAPAAATFAYKELGGGTMKKAPRQCLFQRCAGACRSHPFFSLYVSVSLLLAVVLLVDPLFQKPSGLITTSLFTGRTPQHGSGPCGYDYEGSWQIGIVSSSGASPLDVRLSEESVISCATIGNRTAASYVAEPSLVVPLNGTGSSSKYWYAFYQLKNLERGKGEIGVASSADMGRTWTHLGTALTAEHSLSSPWVTFDPDSDQYIMIPDMHKARQHAVQLWATSKQDFPFGWRLLKTAVEGAHFMDTTALHYQGQWWIFTTVKQHFQGWGERSYSLRLYHAPSLTGDWVEHPMSPVSADLRYARGGGRPFVYDGHVYRWAQDDSDYFGESLHLFTATLLNNDTFLESYVQTLEPSGTGNWYSARTHHVDIQPVGMGGTWFGLIDGDKHKDGMHHFFQHEAAFVRFKHRLLKYDVLQLLLVCFTYVLMHTSGKVISWLGHLAWVRALGKGQSGVGRVWAGLVRVAVAMAPELQLFAVMAAGAVLILMTFALWPQLFWCPRQLVKVDVIPTPPVKHHDPRGPFNVSDLVIVTGATASFFDRLTNMVGSVHHWEPQQKVVVYDLGFSQSQLAKMMCWENVEVRRFPYEKYPAHVMEVRNYAFKALVLQEALADFDSVLWIDSGLELRTNMTTMRRELAQHGHVSAMQEDSIGDDMYTYTKTMVDFFGLGHQWDSIKKWQFCAGGLQGFVRGSDAERLVLKPVVNCSLHEEECIAPKGASRKNSNFDQTSFTIQIWANNFSCLPRETHCMWSVKKASADPTVTSEPIEVVSRGHRLPKPYASYVRRKPSCIADKSKVPWPAIGLEHQESLSRYNLSFRISRIYLQPIGDGLVQCLSCMGAQIAIQASFWVLITGCMLTGFCALLQHAWQQSRQRMALDLSLAALVLLAVQTVTFVFTSQIR